MHRSFFSGGTHGKRGFTLLEILLVVGLLALLAGIVILALSPARQIADTRNAQRKVDVNTILNAVYQHAIDNNGAIAPTVTTTQTEICKTGAGSCSGLIDLSTLTTSEKYLTAIPQDPQCTTVCAVNGVGYEIKKSANSRITVYATHAENGAVINATR